MMTVTRLDLIRRLSNDILDWVDSHYTQLKLGCYGLGKLSGYLYVR